MTVSAKAKGNERARTEAKLAKEGGGEKRLRQAGACRPGTVFEFHSRSNGEPLEVLSTTGLITHKYRESLLILNTPLSLSPLPPTPGTTHV